MSTRKRTKYIHEGSYVAEVDVQRHEDSIGWSPYLTIADAWHRLLLGPPPRGTHEEIRSKLAVRPEVPQGLF